MFLMAYSPVFAQNSSSQAQTLDLDLPAYLSTSVIPLSNKEKQALKLSTSWISRGAEPFLAANGKLVYVYGVSMPSILASPLQVCDVELQEGESINEIIVGDNARWQVETGQAGNTTHIFIKPLDTGLETNAVVTTDKRVYHLRLISTVKSFTPYIGFTYADDLRTYVNKKQKQQEKTAFFESTKHENKEIDLLDLNFNYEVKGKALWKPVRVYDDGNKTFIKLPKETKSNEMPILLVRKDRNNVIVNYRVKKRSFIVDGIFGEMILVLGVGASKEQVNIKRVK